MTVMIEAARRFTVVLTGVFLAQCIACGSGSGTKVSGTLKLGDGSPVVKARVTARNDATGDWASGITNEEGFFELGTEKAGERLPLGSYQVTIIEDQGDWDHPTPPKISRKYNRPDTSGLMLTVEPGNSQTFDIVVDPA